MKKLIINADDYGLTPGVGLGIRRAHLEGVVTSTTVMMTTPYISMELPLLLKTCPRMGVGVHLCVTAGQPVLPFERLPSLQKLSPDGVHFQHDLADRAAGVDLEELLEEWQAQVEQFIRFTGRSPDHLDAHHHAMGFTPAFLEVYLQLARMYACPIRLPVPGERMSAKWPDFKAGIQEMLRANRIRSTGHIELDFFDALVGFGTLENLAGRLPDGTTEWMCHPGMIDEPLIQSSGYTLPRQRELELLTSQHVKALLAGHSIELVTFREV